MGEPVIELGEHTYVGRHCLCDIKICDCGKVYRNTPQKINGMFHPPHLYYDATGALLPNAVTEWFWCQRCKRSTKTGELVMSEVK